MDTLEDRFKIRLRDVLTQESGRGVCSQICVDMGKCRCDKLSKQGFLGERRVERHSQEWGTGGGGGMKNFKSSN